MVAHPPPALPRPRSRPRPRPLRLQKLKTLYLLLSHVRGDCPRSVRLLQLHPAPDVARCFACSSSVAAEEAGGGAGGDGTELARHYLDCPAALQADCDRLGGSWTAEEVRRRIQDHLQVLVSTVGVGQGEKMPNYVVYYYYYLLLFLFILLLLLIVINIDCSVIFIFDLIFIFVFLLYY